MRLTFLLMGIFFLLVGLRFVNVHDDVFTAIVAGFLGILCLWAAITIKKLQENEEVE